MLIIITKIVPRYPGHDILNIHEFKHGLTCRDESEIQRIDAYLKRDTSQIFSTLHLEFALSFHHRK